MTIYQVIRMLDDNYELTRRERDQMVDTIRAFITDRASQVCDMSTEIWNLKHALGNSEQTRHKD